MRNPMLKAVTVEIFLPAPPKLVRSISPWAHQPISESKISRAKGGNYAAEARKTDLRIWTPVVEGKHSLRCFGKPGILVQTKMGGIDDPSWSWPSARWHCLQLTAGNGWAESVLPVRRR